ncbi:MAG: acyl carrier protein [Bacteroidota bacterium]
MNFEEALQKIISLAGEQFPDAKVVIDEATGPQDIPSWNSLKHVMFIASIEKAFGIKFDLLQMIDQKSIGDIARATHETLK